MVEIPLILKLKKQVHKDIARAQDIIVKEVYAVFDKATMHGGTSIWRCYNGNRFSEDIDMYLTKDINKIGLLFENLKRNGFIIKKEKIGEKSLYSNLEINRTTVRFEALFRKYDGHLKEYLTSDGNFITIYTLTPEELIKEKVAAYLKRYKIRDLYDIFFLLRYSQEDVSQDLRKLVNNYKDPVDEKELKVLIIEGLVPSTLKMVDYIRKWEKKNI